MKDKIESVHARARKRENERERVRERERERERKKGGTGGMGGELGTFKVFTAGMPPQGGKLKHKFSEVSALVHLPYKATKGGNFSELVPAAVGRKL